MPIVQQGWSRNSMKEKPVLYISIVSMNESKRELTCRVAAFVRTREENTGNRYEKLLLLSC
jgi:hypothetical protein